MFRYLYNIDSPDDLKKLSVHELHSYCDELRRFIIEQCAQNPGHLASSLGTVELTVALHYVLHTPDDKLIWDVGHQAYAHKIITGRRDRFASNRRMGGISGFPKPSESPYDAFGVGHSSTSISAALGMATASKMLGENRQIVAVIGDGAMTGGLAFEGLNNAGILNTDLLVILNDNNMSIDKNVGALHKYLLKISTSRRYNYFKAKVWDALSGCSGFRHVCQNVTNGIKQGFLRQSNLFESLNFRYFGPVDGHDVEHLTRVLADLREIKGPKLLHVLTTKGKGFAPAECNNPVWHAPGKFNPDTGERIKNVSDSEPPKYQDVFGHTVLELARQNPKIVGITPAMPTGCSLSIMMNEMPDRCFDVGIAEGHAVTFSAGLAMEGLLPFCNIYSSFMQRAYDHVIHDAALQNLNVVFCLDRGGLVGEDGPTHHGAFDLAYFRCIPNLTIAAPRNEVELRNLMYTAQLPEKGVFVIRYPRGCGVTAQWRQPMHELTVGEAEVLKEGHDIAVISVGETAEWAARAIESVEARHPQAHLTHVDARFVKPFDRELIDRLIPTHRHLITIENGTVEGGFGSAVADYVNGRGYAVQVHKMGIPDRFIEHGTPAELFRLCGFDQPAVEREIEKLLV